MYYYFADYTEKFEIVTRSPQVGFPRRYEPQAITSSPEIRKHCEIENNFYLIMQSFFSIERTIRHFSKASLNEIFNQS